MTMMARTTAIPMLLLDNATGALRFRYDDADADFAGAAYAASAASCAACGAAIARVIARRRRVLRGMRTGVRRMQRSDIGVANRFENPPASM